MTSPGKYSSLCLRAIACFVGVIFSSAAVEGQSAQSPNFIVILTDDLGWTSLSSRSDKGLATSRSDYHVTSNLDQLSARGMRFSRSYSADPICSPSRRSLQFGQTSIRQGDDEFARKYATGKLRVASIPEVLKKIDDKYTAAHFGKWDLRAGITPEDLGYDVSDGDTGNSEGNRFVDKEDKWLKKYLLENPKQMDSLTARAIHFISTKSQAKQPFYLQVSHYATHLNFETRPETFGKVDRMPKGTVHHNAAWAGMIYDLDDCIGHLIDTLDSLGLSDNTFIFFMSDNGGVEFIPVVSNRLEHPASFDKPMRNTPLRGGKWTLYEGGIRVPFFVVGPGIASRSYSEVPVVGWDLLPTIRELAGGKQWVDDRIDGGSLAQVLKSGGLGKVGRPSEDFYFHRFHEGYPHSAVIRGDYKLIHFWKTNRTELYNLKKDIGETVDLSGSQPERLAKLKDALFTYIKRNNEALATKYLEKGHR